jgi:hypothetical protein
MDDEGQAEQEPAMPRRRSDKHLRGEPMGEETEAEAGEEAAEQAGEFLGDTPEQTPEEAAGVTSRLDPTSRGVFQSSCSIKRG